MYIHSIVSSIVFMGLLFLPSVASACSSDTDCSSAERCDVTAPATTGTCIARSCSDDADCGTGFRCRVVAPLTTGSCIDPTNGEQGSESAEYVELVNPLGGTEENKTGITSIPQIIGTVINAALGLAGSVALVVFVYGAFVWMTSAGKSDQIQQGARTMLYAAIGLFIIFSAYGILGQVISVLTG